MLNKVCAVQPALSYTAPELVKGAQQSNGALFSAADVFSLGMCHCLWLALEALVAMPRSVVPPALVADTASEKYSWLTSGQAQSLKQDASSLVLNQLLACQNVCSV